MRAQMRLLWESSPIFWHARRCNLNDGGFDSAAVQANILQCRIVKRTQLGERNPPLMPAPDLPPQRAQELRAERRDACDRRLRCTAVSPRLLPPPVRSEKFHILRGHRALLKIKLLEACFTSQI